MIDLAIINIGNIEFAVHSFAKRNISKYRYIGVFRDLPAAVSIRYKVTKTPRTIVGCQIVTKQGGIPLTPINIASHEGAICIADS